MTSRVFDSPSAAAQSQLGVYEPKGKNDGTPFERYVRETNPDRDKPIAWCAAFVVWCYEAAGIPVPGNKWKLASVDYLEGQARIHGRFAKREHVWALHKMWIETEMPEPGDIIFFGNRGDSDDGNGRHCGLVEFLRGDIVHTIEGNKSNRVGRGSYHLNLNRITGFGRFSQQSKPAA